MFWRSQKLYVDFQLHEGSVPPNPSPPCIIQGSTVFPASHSFPSIHPLNQVPTTPQKVHITVINDFVMQFNGQFSVLILLEAFGTADEPLLLGLLSSTVLRPPHSPGPVTFLEDPSQPLFLAPLSSQTI